MYSYNIDSNKIGHKAPHKKSITIVAVIREVVVEIIHKIIVP